MTLADQIRTHVIERHLRPARECGARDIELRAGDIHHELRLSARMPAVCSALGGAKLGVEAQVTLTRRTGPAQGANVWFTYAFESGALPSRNAAVSRSPATANRQPPLRSAATARTEPDLPGALVLVACTKSKQHRAAPARALYTSTFFVRARSWIARRGADWRILSAEHGLLAPDAAIAPYELTLNRLGIAERRRWAERVLADLAPLATRYPGVVFLAGQRYREFLIPALEAQGVVCTAPMAHLAQGEQLAWLGAP